MHIELSACALSVRIRLLLTASPGGSRHRSWCVCGQVHRLGVGKLGVGQPAPDRSGTRHASTLAMSTCPSPV